MKKIKILLGDPRHNTRGVHSSYVPIGIGYIGEFLKAKIQHINIKLKLATNPEEIFTLLEDWKPDIVGMSNYVWNSGLSNSICKYAKEINVHDKLIEWIDKGNNLSDSCHWFKSKMDVDIWFHDNLKVELKIDIE